MGLFDQLTAPLEPPAHPRGFDAWLEGVLAAQSTAAGQSVTEGSALKSTVVLACVRLLSESVASLPLKLYRRTPPGKAPQPEHPLWRLLHDRPNPVMTSFSFRETMQGHLLLWGNAYAYMERGARGVVSALWPLRPDKTEVKIDKTSGLPAYTFDYRGVKREGVPASSVLHIPGLGFDGITGYSPIGLMRQAVGMALAAENFGAQFFGNSAMPSGLLSHPKQLTEPAAKRLAESWEQMHGGGNKWRVAVLEEGLSWTSIGIKPDEAQFIETRNLQALEITRAFGVPPWMVGVSTQGTSLTYANVEQQQIAFVTHTLRAWMVRWEQALNSALLADPALFFEFNADALLRGDLKSRYEAYQIGRTGGWLSVNDIRARENMNPVPGGDTYAGAGESESEQEEVDAPEQEEVAE